MLLMVDECQAHEAERRLGTEEAEAFDRQLRAREIKERDDLLQRISASPAAAHAGPHPAEPYAGLIDRPSLETLRLRSEVERLTIYYNAVQRSRAWRLAQRLRRLMGRQIW